MQLKCHFLPKVHRTRSPDLQSDAYVVYLVFTYGRLIERRRLGPLHTRRSALHVYK